MVGTEDPVWFKTRPEGAARDLFEVFAQRLTAIAADAAAHHDTARELAVRQARAQLAAAQRGDWQPLEHHLRELGTAYANDDTVSSAWFAIADRFYAEIAPRLVEAYASEPARLSQALLVLGEFMGRALTEIAGAYDAVRARRAAHAADVRRDELAASATRLEILARTAHEFAAASGNIDGLLALVARRLGEILGDGCAVRLISADGLWLEPSASFYHRDPENQELARAVLGSERQQIGTGLAGRVALRGAAELVAVVDLAQLQAAVAPAFRALLARLGITSALAVPLRSRGRTIGAISLLRCAPDRPYTADDQLFAQELADRAGLAIDNAALVGQLEQRVDERTAALETANRELEAFSYSVSHDLRTPLRAIDGFSRMLLADYEGKLDDRAQHYLQRIRAGTQRMSALIDDLLNLARISRVPLKLAELDLSTVAFEVASELRKREPMRLTPIHVAPALRVRGDARLIRIVLDNLLGNAWKFTSKRDDAEIWFAAQSAPGAPPVFHVRDTGAGFDMAYAEKLFVPFQRLHSAHEFDGIGVGLATVQRIIQHHGGRIWAEGAVGKGATFFFSLGPQATSGDHA
ncbi:MAG TPA: ATP-binding protein [Kofleriaceae bacterium]|nr:ATP-binding protein [Kofleriaceae bacterium]